MQTKDDFQFGDVIATHGGSWLAKSIQFMMRIYCERIVKKPYRVLFNHTAEVINLWGDLWIVEALGWGVRVWTIEKSGYLTKKELVILRDKRGFSEKQIVEMSQKVISLGGVRYQYEGLFQWSARILLRVKPFKKENENAIYCSELGAIFINAAYPNTFPRPNETSPMDHVLSPTYEVVDVNGIMKGNK